MEGKNIKIEIVELFILKFVNLKFVPSQLIFWEFEAEIQFSLWLSTSYFSYVKYASSKFLSASELKSIVEILVSIGS